MYDVCIYVWALALICSIQQCICHRAEGACTCTCMHGIKSQTFNDSIASKQIPFTITFVSFECRFKSHTIKRFAHVCVLCSPSKHGWMENRMWADSSSHTWTLLFLHCLLTAGVFVGLQQLRAAWDWWHGQPYCSQQSGWRGIRLHTQRHTHT